MFKKWMVSILLLITSAQSAYAHEGHIEHVLFGWMHSHVGWEHVVTMVLIGAAVYLFRKR